MTIRLLFISVLFLSVLLIYVPVFNAFLRKEKSTSILISVFIISRLAGWFGSYVLIEGLVQSSDLILYYFDEAKNAYNGNIPYIDYPSSYGPLYPYIIGLLLPYWQQPAAIALVIVMVEITAVLIFIKYATLNPASDRHSLNTCLFIYILHPTALYWSGMMAYNSSLVLLFWIAIIIFLIKGKYLFSLAGMGLSLLASKFLCILAAPLLLAHPLHRMSLILGSCIAFILLYFVTKSFGMDLLLPLLREGGRSTSGNIWFLLSSIIPFDKSGYFWKYGPSVLMLGGICAFSYLCFTRWKNSPTLLQLSAAFSTVGWIFMLLSKKTFPHYIPMFLLFTVYALSVGYNTKRIWIMLLMLLGSIGILEPGLWNALGQPAFLHSTPMSVNYIAIFIFDLVLVSIYIYMLTVSYKLALDNADT